ncbi:uncharacterized protein LOC144451749 [Glandiceps talaboti]
MAQFLPSAIRETRDCAVRPAAGLRFGNFSGVVTLPSVGPSHKAGQHAKSYFNNLQIYHKICEWFESWMPWQRRLLLCGLTDRCSNYQLEYLSTALEPVFHRDYITALRGRYPSTPFKKTRDHNGKESSKPTGKVNLELSDSEDEKWEREKEKEVEQRKTETSQSTRNGQLERYVNDYVDDIIKTALSVVSLSQEDGKSEEEKFVEETGRYAREMIQTIIEKSSRNVKELKRQQAVGKSSRASDRTDSRQGSDRKSTPDGKRAALASQPQVIPSPKQVVKSPRPPSQIKSSRLSSRELDSVLGNIPRPSSVVSTPLRTIRDSPHSLSRSLNEPLTPNKLISDKVDKTKHWSFDVGRPVGKLFQEPIKSDVDPLEALLYDNTDEPFNPFTNGNVQHRSSLVATPLSLFCQSPRQHRHRSNFNSASNLSASDFFDRKKIQRLGLMHGTLRTGQTKKPSDMKDIHIPLQKSYKNEKWWGADLLTGKQLVKAQRSHLKQHFRAQLNQVWEWMEEWEDHERGDLLVEIIKISDDELTKFFARCLLQRLRDRTNIDCLPDKALLKIFTFLTPNEVNKAAQVCRRWRYIAAQDELWLVKCEEMGSREGIHSVTKMVEQFKRNYSIDWRLAYQELMKVAHHAKDAGSYYSTISSQYEGQIAGNDKRKPRKLLGFRLEELQLRSAEPTMSEVSSDVDVPLQQIQYSSILPSQEVVKAVSTTDVIQSRESSDSEMEMEIFMEEDTSLRPHPPASQSSKRTLYSRKGTQYSDKRTLTREKKGRSTAGGKTDTDERVKSPSIVEELMAAPPEAPGKPATSQKKRRRKKKHKEEEEDTALDIRPELTQATDILGKAISDHRLEWRKDDGRTLKHTKFAGMVKGVKRVRKLQGHMDCVHCIAFDTRRIISGSLDRTIRVWDIRSGRSIRKMYGHKGGIRCIQFDNERIVSGSWDMTLMVWDIVKFNRLAILAGHKGSISDLKFNSKHLVSASHDRTVRVWCLQTYSCLNVLSGHRDAVTCLSFDGTQVVTGSTDRTIRVTNIFSGECVMCLTGHTEPITAIEVQRDLVISGTLTGVVHFWNKESGEVEAGVKMHDSAVNQIMFLPVGPAGTRYLTASSDSIIKEWDLNTMTCVRQLHGHKGPVRDIQITDDRLVSCSDDGNIRIWDLMTPLLKPPDESHGKTIPTQTIKQGEDDD